MKTLAVQTVMYVLKDFTANQTTAMDVNHVHVQRPIETLPEAVRCAIVRLCAFARPAILGRCAINVRQVFMDNPMELRANVSLATVMRMVRFRISAME